MNIIIVQSWKVGRDRKLKGKDLTMSVAVCLWPAEAWLRTTENIRMGAGVKKSVTLTQAKTLLWLRPARMFERPAPQGDV